MQPNAFNWVLKALSDRKKQAYLELFTKTGINRCQASVFLNDERVIKLSSIFTFLQTTTWIFSASNDENMLPVCPDSFPVWDVFAAACVRPPANHSSAPGRRSALQTGSNQLRRLWRLDICLPSHDGRKLIFWSFEAFSWTHPPLMLAQIWPKEAAAILHWPLILSETSHLWFDERYGDALGWDNCCRVGEGGRGRY